MQNLRKINKLAKEFSKYEMTEGAETEIIEILELSNPENLIGNSKETYSEIIERFCQIDDDLHEIEMIISDLIKKVNELSEEARKAWYAQVSIVEIDKADQSISEQRLDILYDMLDLTSEIMENSCK